MTMLRCVVASRQTQGYMGNSVVQKNQRPSPLNTTTCASSLSQTTQSLKKASKLSSSQVSPSLSVCIFLLECLYIIISCLARCVWKWQSPRSCPSCPQTKMSARRRMEAASMSVSTPLGATVVSAEVALCCMRTNMTAKKVLSGHRCTETETHRNIDSGSVYSCWLELWRLFLGECLPLAVSEDAQVHTPMCQEQQCSQSLSGVWTLACVVQWWYRRAMLTLWMCFCSRLWSHCEQRDWHHHKPQLAR